jgi:hypothetical protein
MALSARLRKLDADLGMGWSLSNRGDPRCCDVADRHYTRQKVGSPQFMPPGACVVLYASGRYGGRAVWGTSMPYARYVKHAWAGAWVCSIFRHEGPWRAHRLVRQAIAATLAVAGDPPALGMITFVNRKAVAPTYVAAPLDPVIYGPRRKAVYGQCFRQAGFREVGETKGGLLALQLVPADMPEPRSPSGHNRQAFIELEAA